LRDRPDVSPLYADLRGLPPALFTVGTLDPLLDDSQFMAARWSAAGNAAELAVYPGGIHAFNAFPLALGATANRRILEFVARAPGDSRL
jgi:acetyl esterase/lipase